MGSSPPNGPNQIPHKKRRTISLSSTDSEDYNQAVNIIPNVKLKPNIEIKIIDQEKPKPKNGPIVISSDDDDDSNEITTNTSSSHSKSQNYSKNSNNHSNSNYFANEELNQAEINFFIS